MPLFHQISDGNVHDARTLQDLVTRFRIRTFQIGPGLFIYDRGIVIKQFLVFKNRVDFR